MTEKPVEVIEYVLVPKAVLDWLCCRGPDANGEWLGQGHNTRSRSGFWWHTKLKNMLKDVPEAADMERGIPSHPSDPHI